MNAKLPVCDAAKFLREPEPVPYDGRIVIHVREEVSPLALRNSTHGRRLIHQDVTWYDRYEWATKPVPQGTYDIRLPVPRSNRKTFAEQKELLLPDEEPLPLAVAEIALLYLKTTDVKDPLDEGWIRCAEAAADGALVALSWYDGRLSVGHYWVDSRSGLVWLAAGTFRGDPCPSSP